MSTTQRTMKQVQTEIWKVAGTKTFSGKDTIVFVNRFTGVVEEFEKVREAKNEGIIIKDDATCEIDTEEMYGMNGYHRARWTESVISDQTKEAEN